MTLREFYTKMCNEFNDGKPLEYKYTDNGGYWKMTKGFDAHGMKEVSVEHYLRVVRMVQEDKEMRNPTRKRGRPKKVHTKYVGDLYE